MRSSMFTAWLPQARRRPFHQHARYVVLGLRRPGFDAARGDQVNRVGVAAHDAGLRRNVVGEDPVAALPGELHLGIGDDVVGFRGKSNDERRAAGFAVGDGRKDIRILDQRERRRAALLFLDLACARALGAPIGDRGGEDGDIGRQRFFNRVEHLPRGLDFDDSYARRVGQVDGTAHQHHVGAGCAAAAAMAWPCLPEERLAM